MAQLRFVFQATTGNQTSNGPNWGAAKEARFINWLWARYAPTNVDGITLPRNPANETIAFQNYADKLYEGTKANIRAWEKEKQEKAITLVDMD